MAAATSSSGGGDTKSAAVGFLGVECCGHDLFVKPTATTVTCPACKQSKSIAAVKPVPTKWFAPYSEPKARCFIVKMSVGSMNHYNDNCLLHIGLSTSGGGGIRIFSFDERGRRADTLTQWNPYRPAESLSIPVVHSQMSDGDWDTALDTYLLVERATDSEYTALQNNCFAFVVGFLNQIGWEGRTDSTKETVVTSIRMLCARSALAVLMCVVSSDDRKSSARTVCICHNH